MRGGDLTAGISVMLSYFWRLPFHLVLGLSLGRNQPWDVGSKSCIILAGAFIGIWKRCRSHQRVLDKLCWKWNLLRKGKEPFISCKMIPWESLDLMELFRLAGVYHALDCGFESSCLSRVEQDWTHTWIIHAHLRVPWNMMWSPDGIKRLDDRRNFHDSAAQLRVHGAIIRNHGAKIGEGNNNFNLGSSSCNEFRGLWLAVPMPILFF